MKKKKHKKDSKKSKMPKQAKEYLKLVKSEVEKMGEKKEGEVYIGFDLDDKAEQPHVDLVNEKMMKKGIHVVLSSDYADEAKPYARFNYFLKIAKVA